MKVLRLALVVACSLLGGFAAVSLTFHSGLSRTCDANCEDEPCAVPPCCNGDVNADGSINIADPIALLQYLFLNGFGPKPLSSCSSGGGALPATGQGRCWNEAGTEIPCNGTTCAGQNGRYQPGCPLVGRFTANGDGTVTDTCTGLIWQQETAPGRKSWCEALAYCENLTLAGRSDWRLPTVRELQSLVDYGRHDPALDPVFGSVSPFYWSSTTFVFAPENAWVVGFLHGHVGNAVKQDTYSVLAVCDAQ